MDKLQEVNFKAVQQALNRMNTIIENQEKRINLYAQSHSMMLSTIEKLQQEVCILKVANAGSGPTA